MIVCMMAGAGAGEGATVDTSRVRVIFDRPEAGKVEIGRQSSSLARDYLWLSTEYGPRRGLIALTVTDARHLAAALNQLADEIERQQ